MLNNIISNWKCKTYRFKKESVLYNKKDYKNRIILKEFRSLYIYIESKKKFQELEFIIWGNAENITHMRLSHHYYIDATFHTPKDFSQLLIFMYKNLLIKVLNMLNLNSIKMIS